jgi:predicted ATPase
LLPDMNVIQLDRLSGENIALLSESMLGEVGREKKIISLLERETEGNAFFLVEVVRALAESAGQIQQIATMTLPTNVFAGGIQRIVTHRLERLDESDLQLLKFAAVAGRILDLELLRAVDLTSDLDAWLIRGANAAVLSMQERHWQFAHDKIREVLLA